METFRGAIGQFLEPLTYVFEPPPEEKSPPRKKRAIEAAQEILSQNQGHQAPPQPLYPRYTIKMLIMEPSGLGMTFLGHCLTSQMVF